MPTSQSEIRHRTFLTGDTLHIFLWLYSTIQGHLLVQCSKTVLGCTISVAINHEIMVTSTQKYTTYQIRVLLSNTHGWSSYPSARNAALSLPKKLFKNNLSRQSSILILRLPEKILLALLDMFQLRLERTWVRSFTRWFDWWKKLQENNI